MWSNNDGMDPNWRPSLNDVYIEQLINDPLYDIREDGSIWSKRSRQGHIQSEWREIALRKTPRGYVELKYQKDHVRKDFIASKMAPKNSDEG